MNKERRKALSDAIDALEKAKEKIEEAISTVETCREEEQDSYDNLPEGVQAGERGDVMSENVNSLDEALSNIEDMPDIIDETINSIQEAIDR